MHPLFFFLFNYLFSSIPMNLLSIVLWTRTALFSFSLLTLICNLTPPVENRIKQSKQLLYLTCYYYYCILLSILGVVFFFNL